MVKQKRSGKAAGYAKDGAVYFACGVLVTGFFVRGLFLSVRFQLAVFGLAVIHLGIDWCKITLARKTEWADGTAAFAIDQCAHFVTIVAAGCWTVRVSPGRTLLKFFEVMRAPSDRVLLLIVVYVGVIFGGYLIRFMTKPLLKHLQVSESAQLSSAGMYIGWLERFLMMTALFLRSPAMAGLILTAKSIARYPEFQARAIRGILSNWDAFEYSGSNRGRNHSAENILRKSRFASIKRRTAAADEKGKVCQLHCLTVEVECGAF
jgi:hypothetical protein